jgi:hypothetical protein
VTISQEQAIGTSLMLLSTGKQVQHASIESFGGTLRDECLNERHFLSSRYDGF